MFIIYICGEKFQTFMRPNAHLAYRLRDNAVALYGSHNVKLEVIEAR